jgi:hypothetical protein
MACTCANSTGALGLLLACTKLACRLIVRSCMREENRTRIRTYVQQQKRVCSFGWCFTCSTFKEQAHNVRAFLNAFDNRRTMPSHHSCVTCIYTQWRSNVLNNVGVQTSTWGHRAGGTKQNLWVPVSCLTIFGGCPETHVTHSCCAYVYTMQSPADVLR